MPCSRSAVQGVLKDRCEGGEEVADCFQTSCNVCVRGNQRVTSKLVHLLIVPQHYRVSEDRRHTEDLLYKFGIIPVSPKINPL